MYSEYGRRCVDVSVHCELPQLSSLTYLSLHFYCACEIRSVCNFQVHIVFSHCASCLVLRISYLVTASLCPLLAVIFYLKICFLKTSDFLEVIAPNKT